MMKGKNVNFDAEKWKNEMIHPGFKPGTFSTEVRRPHPYTTDSLENLAKRIRVLNIQWQKVANIQGRKFKPRKIQNFKGL